MKYKKLIIIFLCIETNLFLRNQKECCNPRVFNDSDKSEIYIWKRNAIDIYEMCNETCVYSKLNDENSEDEYCFGYSNDSVITGLTCRAPDPGVEIGPINKTLTLEYLQDEIKAIAVHQ